MPYSGYSVEFLLIDLFNNSYFKSIKLKYYKTKITPEEVGGNNIYFWIRFGLTNAINDYLRVIIRVGRVWNCLPLMRINWILHTRARFIFAYQKSLKLTFEPCFWVQNHHLNLCFLAVNYFVVKKLMWNVRIKALWYTISIATLKMTINRATAICPHINNIDYAYFMPHS